MPIDGTASLEVGLIGGDGMFGMPLVLGVNASPLGAVVLGAARPLVAADSGSRARERLSYRAGTPGLDVKPIDIPTPFANFDDYGQPFLGGQGPAPSYAMSLDETARARLRDRIRERIPTAANGTISLTARAWAARGTVGK